jgi:hypothetical protein
MLSRTQEQRDVVTRAARTPSDRRMSHATIAARTSCLVHRRRYSHIGEATVVCGLGCVAASRAWGASPFARPPWECCRLEASGSPPLARTGARRRSPSRAGAAATAQPIWEPLPLLRIEELSPPSIWVGEPPPPQPPDGVPPPRALSGQPLPSHAPGWASSLLNRGGASKTES